VGLRLGLGLCGKSRPHWESIPGASSPLAVTIPTELPDRPVHCYLQLKLCGKRIVDLLLDAQRRTDVSRCNEECEEEEEEEIYITRVY
jgi:hypothetical protein